MAVVPLALALTLALGAMGALLAPSAHAGSYDVYACGGPAGGAQNAFVASADSMMSAYSICPPTPNAPGTGIATKVASNGGVAPYGHGAYQVFEAPPGASLATVSFNFAAIRLAIQWTVGVVAYDDNFDGGDAPFGCYAFQPGCGVGTPSFSIPVTVGLNGRRRFRFETRCLNAAGCDASASPFVPANRALFSAANVSVRVQDSSQPSIVPRSGALWSDGWHRGREEAWSGYHDNVGVMATRLFVDGRLRDLQDYRDSRWPANVRCDFTQRRPCSDIDPGSLSVDTTDLADGEHELRIEATDTAGNTASVRRAVRVDNAAPGQVAGLRAEGGEGWRLTNSFDLSWAAPSGQVAPVAAAHYTLCPVAGGACVPGVRRADGIGRLEGLAVPGPGEYDLRLWLEDAAGNQDPDRSAGPVRLRFDDEAPAVAFEGLDPAHPTRVLVSAGDRGSGLAGGVVEIRPSAGGSWRELETRVEADRLIAEIDDEALPDGVYTLRALAWDAAGNERTAYRRRDGAPMEISLPLRVPVVVQLRASALGRGGCRARRGRKPPHGPGGAVHGAGAVVRGRVEAGGLPVAGATVSVFEQPRSGGAFRRVRAVTADSAGGFSVRIPPGPSRTVRFRYQGTRSLRPAARDLRLLAPARSSITVDRAFLRNGRAVRFDGRLLGGPVPRGGKLIDLQAFYRGRWRTFAAPRTDARGRWSYSYRFEATRGRVTYRFRARIRREDAYPYELGCTRTARVTVVG